jgi:hypothetical protein
MNAIDQESNDVRALDATLRRQVSELMATHEAILNGAPSEAWIATAERVHEQAMTAYEKALKAWRQADVVSALDHASSAWTHEQVALMLAERSGLCVPESLQVLNESSEAIWAQILHWSIQTSGTERDPTKGL